MEPAELAQKTAKVDPGADAEIIFWDVRVEDRVQSDGVSLALEHYIRIKIFTDRGKEQESTVEIPRLGKRYIMDVAGRTIKPDGASFELKKDAIYERDLVKTKGLKLRGITFSLPNVEVGDIIEYRYREVRDHETASHLRLYFQREMPLWKVTYHVKPLNVPWLPYTMRNMSFQCDHPPFTPEMNGFFTTSMTNMPAFHREPDMPPEDQVRAWVLIYYEPDQKIDVNKFWREAGKQDYARFKPLMKVDAAVKRTADELVAGAEDGLAALDRFCRVKVKNLDSSASRFTSEESKAIKENRSPGDTLKQMAGRDIDIDLLFAALANAAGYEARMARVPDAGDIFFSPQRPTTYLMRHFSVAVKVGEGWMFYDPAAPYVERSMLRWQQEGQQALVSDPKEGFFAATQYSPAARTLHRRGARFRLLEDGTIEGAVQHTFTGHAARAEKTHYADLTPAQQEEDWKSGVLARLPSTEISDWKMDNGADPSEPVIVRYKLSVPGYATRTGKRILIQPAFFQRNLPSRYTESSRKWDLYFRHSWSEDDSVTIDLPAGWELDQPLAPASAKLSNIGEYSVKLLKTVDGKSLIYQRKFVWGNNGLVLVPATSYAQVKRVFDWVREQDEHAISLKPVAKEALQ